MADLRTTIVGILKADHPQTVRQVFYQLVTRGAVEKTEGEYSRTVVRLLSEMRLDGQISWDWITDESRTRQVTRTFDDVADALSYTAQHYRRSALQNSDAYIEIWSEKQALAGIIWDAASEYDVPVVVSKGMPSLTQIYQSFNQVRRAARVGKCSFIYQFGDHDPTGCLIPRTIEGRLQEFCLKHRCPPPHVERIALTEEQIEDYGLPTRPTKRSGTHHADFEGDSVELDALPSAELRRLVSECIERHISQDQVEILREAEQSEREILEQLASSNLEALP